jgi:hypothetical protein
VSDIRAGRERPEQILVEAMLEDRPGQAIENMEARGQQQLVASTKLPVKTGYLENDDGPYLALGFEFGPPDPEDPIFREAKLPPGWSKQATEHSMHSVIVDERGEERVGVFFKAAFYDRRAHLYMIPQCVCGHSSNAHPYTEYRPRPCSKCACADDVRATDCAGDPACVLYNGHAPYRPDRAHYAPEANGGA